MPIHIEPNKHICIFFHPRSGSTALRLHLTEVIPGLQNLQEFFNLYVKYKFEFQNNKFVQIGDTESVVTRPIAEKKQMIKNRLNHLDRCTQNGLYSVFTAYVQSYMRHTPELTKQLMAREDVQYFYLQRADLLTGVLSLEAANRINIFHNYGNTRQRTIKPFQVSMSRIKGILDLYVQTQQELEAADPSIRKIYYEEFQTDPNNMNLLFSGIATRENDISIRRFEDQINYKNYIINIDEVEDYYRNFVFDNIRYFPQYSGELTRITIPSFQGTQPYLVA
jgi:hypothetical protein